MAFNGISIWPYPPCSVCGTLAWVTPLVLVIPERPYTSLLHVFVQLFSNAPPPPAQTPPVDTLQYTQANATHLVKLSLMLLPPHNPCLPPLELKSSPWSWFSSYLVFTFNNKAWNFSFQGPSLSPPTVSPWRWRAGFIYFYIQPFQTSTAKDLTQYVSLTST